MKRINIHLSDPIIKWYDKEAKRKDAPRAEVIRKALVEYMEKRGNK
jgi:metal-responsive CopG/Arc/MetJ family transcriptional regulator